MPQYRFIENPPFQSDAVFFGILVGELLLGLVLILVGHLAFRIRPNWILFCLATILFVGSLIGLTQETLSGYEVSPGLTFVFTAEEKIRYASCYFVSLEVMYFLLGVLPHYGKGKHVWVICLSGIVIYALVLCGYSFIAEWHIYIHYLKGGAREYYDLATSSLAGERHYWAMALMIGTFACGIGHARTRSAWWLIPMALFLPTAFFTFAKVEITAILVFDILFAGFTTIREWKRHRVTAILCLAFLLGLGTVAGLVIAGVQAPGLTALRSYYELMIENASSGSTMTGRTLVFERFIDLIRHQPSANFFGFGDYLPNYVMSYADPAWAGHGWFHCHNAWLEMISHGGVIRFLIHSAGGVYFLYLVIRGLIKRKQFSYFAVLFACLGYALVSAAEFLNPLDGDAYGLLLLFTVVMPVLHDAVSAKKGEFDAPLVVEKHIVLPKTFGLFDGLVLTLVVLFPSAFTAYAPWCVAISMVLLLIVTGFTWSSKGPKEAFLVGIFGVVSCAFLVSLSLGFGTGRHEWIPALLIGYSPLFAALYGAKAYFGVTDSVVVYLGETFCVRNDAFRRAREEENPKPRFL